MITIFALPQMASRDDQRGQTLAEYALILSLIAILSVVALLFLGGAITDMLSEMGRQV